MSKFPEKLYGNIIDGGDVCTYTDLETAAQCCTVERHPVRVGIYQLVEVIEARLVQSVDTVKVEN